MSGSTLSGSISVTSFASDARLRIDHLLLSPTIAERLVAAEVDREVRGRERASDHAPVWIETCGQKADHRDRRQRDA
jgi:exodeoxyribonuclease-3